MNFHLSVKNPEFGPEFHFASWFHCYSHLYSCPAQTGFRPLVHPCQKHRGYVLKQYRGEIMSELQTKQALRSERLNYYNICDLFCYAFDFASFLLLFPWNTLPSHLTFLFQKQICQGLPFTFISLYAFSLSPLFIFVYPSSGQ